MKNKTAQKNKGFTIVETLVAIFILVLAITGPLTIVSQSLHSSYFSRDQITAFYLAQEAIEYVRNLRDQNALQNETNPNAWLSGIENPKDAASNAQISCVNGSNSEINKCALVRTVSGYGFEQCDSTGCAPLSYDSTTGLYGLTSTGVNSNFTRSIYINKVSRNGTDDDSKEVVVNVEVSWKTGGTTNTFKLRDYLTNWKTTSQ